MGGYIASKLALSHFGCCLILDSDTRGKRKGVFTPFPLNFVTISVSVRLCVPLGPLLSRWYKFALSDAANGYLLLSFSADAMR